MSSVGWIRELQSLFLKSKSSLRMIGHLQYRLMPTTRFGDYGSAAWSATSPNHPGGFYCIPQYLSEQELHSVVTIRSTTWFLPHNGLWETKTISSIVVSWWMMSTLTNNNRNQRNDP